MTVNLSAPSLLLLVALCLLGPSEAQRLSQGASDWYMRFHDFDMVKRHVDRPVTTRFHVSTVVKHRYAVTEVDTDVHNPANVRQVFQFGFAMPKDAFVSSVALRRGNETVSSVVDESDWLAHSGANGGGGGDGDGRAGGGAQHHPHQRGLFPKDKLDLISNEYADFKQFVLPVKLGPGDNVTLTLVYEHLLTRRHDRYTHRVSISPGESVKDFAIRLTIADSSPLTDVNISAPVIGEITRDAVRVDGRDNVVGIVFAMSEVEQMHYFGSHGFTGDFVATFDVDHRGSDLVVQGEHFLHFYDIPEPMPSMPKHVVFLLDASVSMSGPKMDHAKEALKLLIGDLDDTDYINFLTFNETVSEWIPGRNGSDSDYNDTMLPPQAYPVTDNLTAELLVELDVLSPGGTANLTLALLEALSLDRRLWDAGVMPENAYTLFVVLTDGRAHTNHSENKAIRRSVRQANKLSRVPIVILGMGFDANMDFLENIADKSGASAISVIEDLDVEPQLRGVKRFLRDIVIKNLRLNYVGDAFVKESLSRTSFKMFRQGGAVAVAGKWRAAGVRNPEFEVEVTGQSASGLYMENLPTLPFAPASPGPRCRGSIELCSEPRLQGHCVTVNQSRANLHEFRFGNLAASMNISGECAWIAYGDAYYQGVSVALMPAYYDIIPMLMKDISSLKRMPVELLEVKGKDEDEKDKEEEEEEVKEQQQEEKEEEEESVPSLNSIERVWAFLTIQDVLSRLEFRPDAVSRAEVLEATRVALRYNFLTPFTDLYLEEEEKSAEGGHSEADSDSEAVEPASDSLLEGNFVAYKDLNPVFLSLDDPDMARQWEALRSCKKPVQCEGNFHYEEYKEEADRRKEEEEGEEEDPDRCTGSLTLYTKPHFEGESFESTLSIRQLYHSVNSQRLRSVRASGDCCWLLFDQRFFSGDVEKVCGEFEQRVRLTNVGSVKRIGASRW